MSRSLSSLVPGCVILCASLIAGCGGGGGGGSPTPPASPPAGNTPGLVLSLSTSSLQFDALNLNNSPPNQTVTATLTGTASGTLYVVVTTSNPAVATVTNVFVDTVNSTGQGTVVPGSPTALGVGTHTATLTVRACLNDSTCATGQVTGSPQTVNVTYEVKGLKSSVSSLTFNIGNASAPADFGATFTVSGTPVPNSWMAAADVPWLTLTPTTGSTTAAVSVTASLSQATLDTMHSGAHAATITLTPQLGAAVTVPVTLNLERTVLSYVAPYVALSGTSEEVILRGDGFSQLAPTGVSFGGNPATSFTVVGTTEIRATHPVLAAGSHDVRLVTAQGVFDKTYTRLQVVDPTVFAPAALAYPGGLHVATTSLLYDAERRALLAAILDGHGPEPIGRLLRYAYTGTGWAQPTEAPLPYRAGIALTTDGGKLLAGYDDAASFKLAIAELDPVSLAETKVTRYPSELDVASMAVANDGRALIVTGRLCCSGSFPVLSYTPPSGLIENIGQNAPLTVGGTVVGGTVVGGSGDGGTVLLPNNWDPTTSSAPTLRYDSSTSTLVVAAKTVRAQSLQMGRRGSRIVFSGYSSDPAIYDASLTLVGSVPLALAADGLIVAPDERRAYTYVRHDGTVHAFDLAAPPVAGYFQELPSSITVVEDPGVAFALAMTPDGGTLFIAGDEKLVVVPLH